MAGSRIPAGKDAQRRWRELALRDRFALLLGGRSPQTREQARVAVGFARALQERRMLMAALSGGGGLAVWLALSMLVDGGASGETSAPAAVLSAVLFGLVLFGSHLLIAGVQARRLEERGLAVLRGRRGSGA